MGKKKRKITNTEQLQAAQVFTTIEEEPVDPEFGIEHPPIEPEIPLTPLEPAMPAPKPHQVYARHLNKLVNGFFSTCFEEYTPGDVFVKEGFGDEFIHVGSYEVYDENFCHNYRVTKGIKELQHPVLDADGNHAYDEVPREIEVEVEVPKVDDEGNPVMEEKEIDAIIEQQIPVMDDCGHQHIDEDGNPVFETILVPGKKIILVPVMVTVIQKQTVYDKVYKYTTEYKEIDVVVPSTPEQKAEELANMPPAPPTPVQKLENDVQFIQDDVDVIFMAVDETSQATMFNMEDLAFVANAIFELDEKVAVLMGQPTITSTLSDKLLTRKGVSLMAEMWARWIQTGRKTFDQVPAYLKDEVRILLADVGITV